MTADHEIHSQDSPRAPSSPAGPPAGLLTVLLVAVSLATGLALICATGWYLAGQRPARLADLSPQQRWQLLQDAESHNPGVYQATWFAPRIGYTLQPDKAVEAWNTKFTANALGYRSGPPHKPEDTFRLLFVGDSWTFGMGVDAEQAFPQRLARLAQKAQAAQGDERRRIESWSLALPGYNTPAQLAALEYFGDRLAADAVILCPTPNDNHSLPAVTAAGALTYGGGGQDRFAEPHPVVYRRYRVLSHRYLERWRMAFDELAEAADRLSQQELPVFFFFTGTWDANFVHWQIDESAIQQPVAITPMAWTTAEYRNPPPIDHPNAEAHDLYAGLLYDFLAPHLGWPPASSTTDQHPPDVTLARQQALAALQTDTAQMAASFQPGSADPGACTTAGTCRGGQVGAGTTVLIRRSPEAETLELEFARVDLPSLYPQTLQVHIASPNGGTAAQFDIPSAGTLPVFRLPLPTDIAVGHALDVTIQPQRVAADSGSLLPQSVLLRSLGLR